MNDPVMVGTRGWEHAAWSGAFYPPELPDDWRFCYYSNNLRSVLVPQAMWGAATSTDVGQWFSDSDPEFRFVLEVPAVLSQPQSHAHRDRAIDAFLSQSEPIAPRTAGLLLRISPDTPVFIDWFEHLLNRLVDLQPLCVDLPDNEWRQAEPLDALARQGAGLAWRCAHEPEPRPGGRLLVALAPPAGAREVREWIEKIARWQTVESRAGLFFDLTDAAAKVAQEARIIAELMGV